MITGLVRKISKQARQTEWMKMAIWDEMDIFLSILSVDLLRDFSIFKYNLSKFERGNSRENDKPSIECGNNLTVFRCRMATVFSWLMNEYNHDLSFIIEIFGLQWWSIMAGKCFILISFICIRMNCPSVKLTQMHSLKKERERDRPLCRLLSLYALSVRLQTTQSICRRFLPRPFKPPKHFRFADNMRPFCQLRLLCATVPMDMLYILTNTNRFSSPCFQFHYDFHYFFAAVNLNATKHL